MSTDKKYHIEKKSASFKRTLNSRWSPFQSYTASEESKFIKRIEYID